MAKKPKEIKPGELFKLHNMIYSYRINPDESVALVTHKPEKSVKEFVPPTEQEVEIYFSEQGYSGAKDYYRWYSKANPAWHNSKGKPIKDWKATARQVWFEDSRKIATPPQETPQYNDNNNGGVVI